VSSEGGEPIETAPVVAVVIDQDEESLLRKRVGDQDTPMWEAVAWEEEMEGEEMSSARRTRE